MRKMLVAMAKDLRVLIIKLADRLHNMRTLAALPEREAARASPRRRSTSTPRSPIASACRRSSSSSRTCRSPRCTPSATPRSTTWWRRARPSATCTSTTCSTEVRTRLAELQIDAEVTGRPKHLWSIYEKMVAEGQEFDEIFDLVGHPGHRRDREGLLRRARLDPRHVEAGAWAGSRTTSPCPSSTSTSRCTRRWWGPSGKPLEVQIRTARDAPAGRVRRRRALVATRRAHRPPTSPG